MEDKQKIQADLDLAQADLEEKLGQLKDVVKDKLKTPRHVIEVLEKPIAFVRAHPLVVAGAFIGFVVLVRALRHRANAG